MSQNAKLKLNMSMVATFDFKRADLCSSQPTTKAKIYHTGVRQSLKTVFNCLQVIKTLLAYEFYYWIMLKNCHMLKTLKNVSQ